MGFGNLLKSLVLLSLLAVRPAVMAQTAAPTWTPPYDFNDDVVYTTVDGTPLRMDIAVPAGQGPFPAILCFPGTVWGTWKIDKSSFAYILRDAANRRGYVMACADIRGVGKAQKPEDVKGLFPAPLMDAKAAAHFLRDHAGEYHIDTTRMGISGWSSGACVSLLLALTRPSDGFDLPQSEPVRFKAVVANAAASDMAAHHAYKVATGDVYEGTADTTVISLLIGGTPQTNPKNWAAASPITYARAGVPPVLLLHGEKDQRTVPDQSRKLAAALKAAGSECTLILVPEAGHTLSLCNRAEVWAFFDEKLK
jgi:acetyl esterase/lipase